MRDIVRCCTHAGAIPSITPLRAPLPLGLRACPNSGAGLHVVPHLPGSANSVSASRRSEASSSSLNVSSAVTRARR
jgi:hypothetical protein